MNRPELRQYVKPKHIKDYPVGPCYTAGYLVTENSGWRTEKPVVENAGCIGCFYCYLCCPEGVIFKKGRQWILTMPFARGAAYVPGFAPKKQ